MKIYSLRVGWVAGLFAMGMSLSPARATDVLLMPKDAEYSKDGMRLVAQEQFEAWNKAKTSIKWDFKTDQAGDYTIWGELSAKWWHRGSILAMKVDGKIIHEFTIVATEGMELLDLLQGKSVPLSAGNHTFELFAAEKGRGPVCELRNVVVTERKQVKQLVNVPFFEKKSTFAQTLSALRSQHAEKLAHPLRSNAVLDKLVDAFPQEMNWLMQDVVDRDVANQNPTLRKYALITDYFKTNRSAKLEQKILGRVVAELSGKEAAFFAKKLGECTAGAGSAEWLELYERACKVRRKVRLAPLLAKTQSIIFAKHQVFGSRSGIYNITENEGLNPGEKSSLEIIDLRPEEKGEFATTAPLFDGKGGIARDPELSHDGTRLLFAWKPTSEHRNGNEAPDTGNYQIYEMELASRTVRPLTTDETYGSNYEPCYMPNGDILFNSSRIVQHITCGWGDHSNLFMMNKDGKYQRQIGFDQVSTQFPVVLNDGRVIYLRRDYNDRGQSAAHALFEMKADGTGQTEYYGNQTGTPNSFMHARAIPGSRKVATILSGYHTRQGGQLALLDVREGRNNGEGIIQIPQGTTPPSKAAYDDGYLKAGVQYANPFPLSETEFIVARSDTWCPRTTGNGLGEHYAIYFMTADGRSELLSRDATTSSLQPIPVWLRAPLPQRPSLVDYTKDTGVFYLQNVYLGEAVKGLKPGQKIKKIRVVELLYKATTIGTGQSQGPGGGSDTVTPPAHPLALFDTKKILGEATVYEDGSALFEVPARTPVYFQILDEKNRMIQTMRSWSTLMPGENFSCVGCHEDKNMPPATSGKRTLAMAKGVEKLTPFYGAARGFSYLKEIQPIFDAHCIRCHKAEKPAGKKLTLTETPYENVPENEKRRWAQSYVQIMAARPGPDPSEYRVWNGPESWNRDGPAKADEPNQYVMYHSRLNTMAAKPPYFAGAISSGMMNLLEKGHKGVKLPREAWDKLVAWIDLNCPYSSDYIEGHLWSDNELKLYTSRLAERKRNQEIDAENVKQYIQDGQK